MKRNPETAVELLEFERKIKEHGLADVLTGEALVLVFLALGSKMWRK